MVIVTEGGDVVTLEEGFTTLLEPFGWTVTRTGTDLQAKIREHGAVIRVTLLPGGTREQWQAVARVRVEVFTVGYDQLWQTGSNITETLIDAPYHAGPWLIDRCVVESDFAEQSYHESVRLLAAVFRVTTRSARS